MLQDQLVKKGLSRLRTDERYGKKTRSRDIYIGNGLI